MNSNISTFASGAHVLEVDDYDLEGALTLVSAFGTERFGYIVTPNVDHIVRHYEDRAFRELYSQASYVLLDSRFLSHTLGLVRRQLLRVCLGSDLTSAILHRVIKPLDRAVLVGGSPAQAEFLRTSFGLKALTHIEPPMGFIRNPAAVETCLRDIEAVGAFRFCFLAIGSPQQEIIARKLKERGKARGLALCVGASIDFMTGSEQRAPRWMQQAGLEWLYRLCRDPKRLWKRYLVRGPRIFFLLSRIDFRIRKSVASPVPLRDDAAGTSVAVPIATRSARTV